jgi:hypothetical protein
LFRKGTNTEILVAFNYFLKHFKLNIQTKKSAELFASVWEKSISNIFLESRHFLLALTVSYCRCGSIQHGRHLSNRRLKSSSISVFSVDERFLIHSFFLLCFYELP